MRNIERQTLTLTTKPVICSICGLEIKGTDREIVELNRMRHIRNVHQIPRCSPDFY